MVCIRRWFGVMMRQAAGARARHARTRQNSPNAAATHTHTPKHDGNALNSTHTHDGSAHNSNNHNAHTPATTAAHLQTPGARRLRRPS
jgi:hypothetical protein